MAKNLLFVLLLCTIPSVFTPIIAAKEVMMPENVTLKAVECDAPPPDSFRVVEIGSNGVSLSWTPAWLGATHTLVLFLHDDSNGWTNLTTYYSVSGSSYTITGLTSGFYKIVNATNCTNGETSIKKSEEEFKIIELTTAGRIPANPVPVNGCEGINMNINWVGFRITKIGTEISNIFEITLDGQVKRVFNANRIVAVNSLGDWPKGPMFPLSTSSPFRIDDLVDGNPANSIQIGYLKFNENGPSNVQLCKSLTPVLWKSEYSFTVLTAISTIIPPQSIGGGGVQGFDNEPVNISFKAESPFSNNLNLFIPQTFTVGEKAIISLLNINGKLVLKHTIDLQTSQAVLQTDWILPGVYTLQIKTEKGVQSFNVIKSK